MILMKIQKMSTVLAYSSMKRVELATNTRTATLDSAVAACRSDLVETGIRAIENASNQKGKAAVKSMDELKRKLGNAIPRLQKAFSSPSPSSPTRTATTKDARLVALKAEVDGRMSKALQGQERFNRWGKHYLRALTRSHQLEQCTNFMDPGLQVYGGEMFRENRDKGDEVFLSLPPPKKSCAAAGGATYNYGGGNATGGGTTNMQTYYAGAGGGCFSGESKVLVLRGCSRAVAVPIRDVKKGDFVRVFGSTSSSETSLFSHSSSDDIAAVSRSEAHQYARVECVVRLARAAGKKLVQIGDGNGGGEGLIQITPRHPVFFPEHGWITPEELLHSESGATLGEHQKTRAIFQPELHFVYNLFLERGKHTLSVGGVACATWGHGLSGALIQHPFFGDYDRILSVLKARPGFADGFVDFPQCGGLASLLSQSLRPSQTPDSTFQSAHYDRKTCSSRLAKTLDQTDSRAGGVVMCEYQFFP